VDNVKLVNESRRIITPPPPSPQRLLKHPRRLPEISPFPSTTTAGTPLIPRETHSVPSPLAGEGGSRRLTDEGSRRRLKGRGAKRARSRPPLIRPRGASHQGSAAPPDRAPSDEGSTSPRPARILPPMTQRLRPATARKASAVGAAAVGTAALGTFAIGAVAVGALAVGALAIGVLRIGKARVRRLHVDELSVGTLRIGKIERR